LVRVAAVRSLAILAVYPVRLAATVPRYDPSGLVKGWAVQRAARHLAGLDGNGWCLNAGGDVLVQVPADQPSWRVGTEDARGRSLTIGASRRLRVSRQLDLMTHSSK